MRSVASVCLCVCPVRALTFECLDLETWFWCADARSQYLALVRISWSSDQGQGQGHRSKKVKLEKVAINDVLPLKAARRDAIAKWKFLGPRDTSDLTSMVPFTYGMRRHHISLAL